jgi:hypothetical protein
MPADSVTFRYPRGDALRAVAERRGVQVSTLLRSLADAALASEGFPVVEQQYALVTPAGEILTTTLKPGADDRGQWVPIENVDSEPFDKEKHWRLPPESLRFDDGRVVRRYPVVVKSWEHA